MLRPMRPSIPEGWPGLVGIVVLVAGILAVHARPSLTPLGGSAAAAGGYLQEFAWASLEGPAAPLDVAGAPATYAAVDAFYDDLGADAYAERRVAMVATFASAGDAAAAAEALDLPRAAASFVQDRMLLVTGLRSVIELAPPAEDGVAGPLVLVEGDRGGEGSIVLDLTCRAASNEAAGVIAAALGDYAAVPYYAYLRPPWVGHEPTTEEAIARATYRSWMQTFAQSLRDDPYLAAWADRLMAAGSEAERRRLNDELAEYVRERRHDLGADAHPGVAALLAASPDGSEPDDYKVWGLELGDLMGQLPGADRTTEPTWYEQRHTAQIGSVQAAGDTVRLGWVTFNAFALGASGLLSYLDARGCTDARITLSDFDDVRGD